MSGSSGRTSKVGLDYWDHDTSWYRDKRIMAAQALVDPEGVDLKMRYMVSSFYRDVVNEIYRDKGYLILGDHDTILALSSTHFLPTKYIIDFIRIYVQVGLFDGRLYLEHNILTSGRIQKNWLRVQKSHNRKTGINEIYDLTGTHDENKSVDNSENIPRKSTTSGKKSTTSGKKSTTSGNQFDRNKSLLLSNNISILEDKDNTIKEIKEEKEKHDIGQEKHDIGQEKHDIGQEKHDIGQEKHEPIPVSITNALNDQKGEFAIQDCLWKFFNENKFGMVMETAAMNLPSSGHLTRDERVERLKGFAEAFNRELFNRVDLHRLMHGNSGWPIHFRRWLAGVRNIAETDPGTIMPDVISPVKDKQTENLIGVTIPWESDVFKHWWKEWKVYLFTEKEKDYKSVHGEQAALMQLAELASGVESTAIAIIKQSMGSGWKTLQKLKLDNDGTTGSGRKKEPTGKDVSTASAFAAIDAFHAKQREARDAAGSKDADKRDG